MSIEETVIDIEDPIDTPGMDGSTNVNEYGLAIGNIPTDDSKKHVKVDYTKTNTATGISDEPLRALKRQMTTAASAVTRKKNEIITKLASYEELHHVKRLFEEYKNAFKAYEKHHNDFAASLQLSDDVQRARRDHQEKVTVFIGFKTQVDDWINKAEDKMQSQMETRSRSSTSSTKSYVSAKIKLAELQIRQKMSERVTHIAQENAARKAELLKRQASEKTKLQEEIAAERARVSVEDVTRRARIEEEEMVRKAQFEFELQREQIRAQKAKDDVQLDIEIAQAMAAEQIIAEEIGDFRNVNFNVNAVEFNPESMMASTPAPKRHVTIKAEELSDCSNVNLNVNTVEFNPESLMASTPAPTRHVTIKGDASQQPEMERNYLMDQTIALQKQTEMLMKSQRQMTNALLLPPPDVPVFKGDSLEFSSFMRSFETRIIPNTVSDTERLNYLSQYLSGEPKKLIKACTYMEKDGYQEAMSMLKKEYGDPYKVATEYVNKVLQWKTISKDDAKGLKELSLFLSECNVAMKSFSYMDVLNHVPNMQAIVRKIPMYLQNKWSEAAIKIRENQGKVEFNNLAKFVQSAASVANDPAFGHHVLKSKRDKQANSSFAIQFEEREPTTTQTYRIKCRMCTDAHDIEDCPQFVALSLREKKRFMMERGLCFGCFGYKHLVKGCINRRKCKKCNKRHPTSLHDDDFVPAARLPKSAEAYESCDEVSSNACNSKETLGSPITILQSVIPVKVCQRDGAITDTYAFYDNGSTGCFITEELMDKLQLHSEPTTLKLRTINGVEYIESHAVEDLKVMDIHGKNQIELPRTFSKEEIPVTIDQIPTKDTVKFIPSLAGLSERLPNYDPELSIGILIGSNCPEALQPLSVIPAQDNGAFGVKYKHGWTVNGPVRVTLNEANEISCHKILLQEVQKVKEMMIPNDVIKMFEMDFSERDKGRTPDERGFSREDLKFLAIVEKRCDFKAGHYVIPLPFRNVDPKLENNRYQAAKRAEWQRKKMLKNEKYHSDYVKFVQKLIDKGYGEFEDK